MCGTAAGGRGTRQHDRGVVELLARAKLALDPIPNCLAILTGACLQAFESTVVDGDLARGANTQQDVLRLALSEPGNAWFAAGARFLQLGEELGDRAAFLSEGNSDLVELLWLEQVASERCLDCRRNLVSFGAVRLDREFALCWLT